MRVAQGRRGPKPIYCSDACRFKARTPQHYEPTPKVARACVVCGAGFHGRPDQKYCPDGSCKKQCVICGAGFTGSRAKTTCSFVCAQAIRTKNTPTREIECTNCRKQLSCSYVSRGKNHFCSPSCRNRFYCNNKRARKKAQGVGEDVSIGYIYSRDGGTCHLCRGGVDEFIRWPSPQCPTMDHIVPLSKGGEHSKRNIKLAHMSCNSSKHTRVMGEQMLLVG